MTALRAKTPVRFNQDSTSDVSQWNANDPTSGDRLKDKIVNVVSDRRFRSDAIQATSKPKPRRSHGAGGYDQQRVESPSAKDMAKFISEQLCEARGKIKFIKQTDVVSGVGNLNMMDTLKNRGKIKRLLN